MPAFLRPALAHTDRQLQAHAHLTTGLSVGCLCAMHPHTPATSSLEVIDSSSHRATRSVTRTIHNQSELSLSTYSLIATCLSLTSPIIVTSADFVCSSVRPGLALSPASGVTSARLVKSGQSSSSFCQDHTDSVHLRAICHSVAPVAKAPLSNRAHRPLHDICGTNLWATNNQVRPEGFAVDSLSLASTVRYCVTSR